MEIADIDDLQPDDLTKILKDKKFLVYLLQSLADHYGKLLDLKYVKIRPEFTTEFFATYWLLLINKIDLRITTQFVLNTKKLADENEIEERNKFMLVLLFVAFWIADKNNYCPNVTLKEPMSLLVHACFNKFFKDIYRGNDEDFKTFIFADNKENSRASPNSLLSFSNLSLNSSDFSGFNNATPNVKTSAKPKISISESDCLKEKNHRLKDTVERLQNEKQHLEAELDAKKNELENINIIYSDLIESKHDIHENLMNANQEIAALKNQINALKDVNEKLQKERQQLEEEIDNVKFENDQNPKMLTKDDDANSTVTEIVYPQRTSSSASSFLMFSLSLLIFTATGIYFFGALVPSWILHHDHLPPQ
uniref:Uncharacterized protein n=1 Tax=Panagrolaimus sp. ES5 TaxID=591445 RepID=A0AC34GU38_9BILA